MATHNDTEISWQDYVTIVIRRRWYFLVPCLAIIGIAFLVGMSMPRIFRAETVIMVQEPGIMNPLIQGLAISTPAGERLRTLREELLGWTNLNRLVHEMQMDAQAKSPSAMERLIRKLQQDIEVRMSGRDLVHIYYEDQDPKLAQRLVNTVSTVFLQRHTEANQAEAGTAISFIEQEMDVYKKKLEDSERALRQFKELYTTQMPVATQLNQQIVDMQVELEQRLIDSTEEHPGIIVLRRHIKELKDKRNAQIKQVIAGAIAKGQDAQEYQSLLDAMDQPVPDGAAVDPKVKAAHEAFVSMVEQMNYQTPSAQQPQSLAPQIAVLAPTVKGSSLKVMTPEPISISLGPWQEQELAHLTRDYQSNEETYQILKKRLEQANITKDLGESDEGLKFKVLEPARLPLHPVKPNMLKIMGFALFLGAFVGAGVAFVAEYLDQSFQSSQDLQAALGVPVLGTISRIVTDEDVEARRHRIKRWLSPQGVQDGWELLSRPVTERVNQLLLQWKL